MKLITHPDSHAMRTSIRATALVFEDALSRALLDRVELVAPSEANVLIIGETGTGKELIARQVHALSHRSRRPFVPVNCGALSDTLAESELFGHEKGAFTGASSTKSGWFEAANGGTLFLDEIGDLPLSIQVKLLRVLQEREVYRLGSRTPIPIDVRIVAATNVRLEQAVAAGHFREDLYYRLKVASLELPPLRARPKDILPIAQYFVDDYCRRLGYRKAELSPAARARLLAHPWPGNIRELENVIHQALLVCRHDLIEVDDLQLASALVPTNAFPVSADDVRHCTLEATLLGLFEEGRPDLYQWIEDTVMRSAFQYCQQNQLQTARLLGISRNIVRARLIRLGEIGSPQADAPSANRTQPNSGPASRPLISAASPTSRAPDTASRSATLAPKPARPLHDGSSRLPTPPRSGSLPTHVIEPHLVVLMHDWPQ